MKRVALPVLSVVVFLAVVAAGAAWRIGDASSQSRAETPNASAPDSGTSDFDGRFSLIDQYGKRRSDTDFRKKYMLVFFGYTYCPDVCPTTLAIEAEALDKIGPRAAHIVPIFITVDPKRDTPEKLKSYLSSFDAKASSPRIDFVGLTGTDEEIAQAAKGYRVYYKAHLDGRIRDADYSIDHTGDIYLMDPDGKFVAYYSQGILPDELATDLVEKIPG
jgi:protein SCO1/2